MDYSSKFSPFVSNFSLKEPDMSNHSDDDMLIVGSDSFWEPGNYKRTTRRIEDSFRLCNDLILLIQERSEIEKTYAESLTNWSKKWNEIIEKGPEYGTTEAAWKAVLIEANRRSAMHLRVKDQLLNETSQIKTWQKDNFYITSEKREMDDSFKKAQKLWAELLAQVSKCKADYHTACKNERSAVNQERNASADTSLSPDQVTKLQDRVTECKYEAQRAKERYEQTLQEINDYNAAKYIEDMTVVFDKCQELEEKRLDFFKEMLFGIHGCLNISTDAELPQIYEEYRHSIQNADSKKDLKWWSNNHGVGMPMNWPQYEEYSTVSSNRDSGIYTNENPEPACDKDEDQKERSDVQIELNGETSGPTSEHIDNFFCLIDIACTLSNEFLIEVCFNYFIKNCKIITNCEKWPSTLKNHPKYLSYFFRRFITYFKKV